MPAYEISTPEVEKIAKKIIEDHREDLKILNLRFIFRPEAPISDQHVIAGMTVKTDDRNWALHKHDFLIEIAKDVWDEAEDDFKVALVDHELGHVGIHYDDDGQPKMDEKSGRIRTYCRRHDIEEFEDVLARHGAYHRNLRKFLEAFVRNKEETKKRKKEEKEEVEEC